MSNTIEFVYLFCDHCQVLFEQDSKLYKARVRNNYKLTFCSKKCQFAEQKARFDASIAERFWSSVDKTPGHGPNGDCWVWTKSLNPGGYGMFRIFGHARVATWTSFYLEHGYLPDFKGKGEMLCHTCDFRTCVRPNHIFLGNNDINAADRCAKGRQTRGEDIQHSKLTEEEVIAIRLITELSDVSVSNAELSELFGVGTTCIRNIRNGSSWKHIGSPLRLSEHSELPKIAYIDGRDLEGNYRLIPVEPIYFNRELPQNTYSG